MAQFFARPFRRLSTHSHQYRPITCWIGAIHLWYFEQFLFSLYTISNRYLYGSESFRQFVYYFRLLSIRNDHPFTRNWSPPDSYARRNHIWLAGIFFPLSFGWLLISVLFFILFIYVLIASVFVVDFVLLFLSLRFVYLNEFVHDNIFSVWNKNARKRMKNCILNGRLLLQTERAVVRILYSGLTQKRLPWITFNFNHFSMRSK